ncbi:hypothetical protein B0H14DRAFT_3648981 [Mycena olivaceomarginata]|nr:hypothetical protein B0H14DRAFT_3648981 [Mycena olivaceomarginata]
MSTRRGAHWASNGADTALTEWSGSRPYVDPSRHTPALNGAGIVPPRRPIEAHTGLQRDGHGVHLIKLEERTGARGILVVAGSNVNDTIVPVCMGSTESLDFCSSALKMSSTALASTFEAFSRPKSNGAAAEEGPFLQNRGEVVRLLTAGLHTVTGKTKLRIEYLNFEEKMMCNHGVKLVEWPPEIDFKAPSNIQSTEKIAKLLHLCLSFYPEKRSQSWQSSAAPKPVP